MSTNRKIASRKVENLNAFPEDFFATLNLTNLRRGPKMSKLVCRQVRKNDNSLTRARNRERSLDATENYLLATPEVTRGRENIKFPKINPKRTANTSMFVGHQNTGDSGYSLERPDRYDIRKRRLHRYMKSEDRFRRHKIAYQHNNYVNALTHIRHNTDFEQVTDQFVNGKRRSRFRIF